MFETFAAKFGALAVTPFLLFGGHGDVSQNASVKAEVSPRHAQAQVNAGASSSASWKYEDSVCTTIDRTLRFGSFGSEVRELQNFLRAEGYLRAQASGFYGTATVKAVKSFQAKEGLTASGVVGAETRDKITAVSCDDDGTSGDLAITGITAPSSLAIGEEGTWTVNVSGEAEGNLSYSVKWGDEGALRLAAVNDDIQSSASFTHTYSEAGTYTPTFTVTDGSGETVTEAAATVTVGEDASVEITSLSATSGYAGDTVTITGSGFTSNTKVYVGSTEVSGATVASDTSISFTVPSLAVGSYAISVKNDAGTSNSLTYELKAKAATRVSVSGVDAPVRLSVNEEGTWTVKADTNVSGNLSYSVTWGDEGMFARALKLSDSTQTSSTFTHSYAKAGTYTPRFTVSDGEGHKSSVSATVVVSE